MSRNNRKIHRKNTELTVKEKLIARLHNLITKKKIDSEARKTATSLITWYMRNKSLTFAQWKLVDKILECK